MSGPRDGAEQSKPLPVPSPFQRSSSQDSNIQADPVARAASIARLASPISSIGAPSTPVVRQSATPAHNSESPTPLAGHEGSSSILGPGHSTLAAALQSSFGRSPPRFGTPPVRSLSPGVAAQGSEQVSTYGSFDKRSCMEGQALGSATTSEKASVVRRHLVQPSDLSGAGDQSRHGRNSSTSVGQGTPSDLKYQEHRASPTGVGDDEFSSLQLQGGDTTRQVYRWSEIARKEGSPGGKATRSKSFNLLRPHPESEVLDIGSINVPGGFRRDHLRRTERSPCPKLRGRATGLERARPYPQRPRQPRAVTTNFIEFLTLYGHFAGEELEEDNESNDKDEETISDQYEDPDYFGIEDEEADDDDREPGEDSNLLTPGTPGRLKRRLKDPGTIGNNTSMGATLLLLKSFLGTGVLFLPKAYLNGGMLFSTAVLLGLAILNSYCFLLLVNTRTRVEGSFGDMGGILYGKFMRDLILSSIALSQIGFVAAYIVFTSENLQAFVLAVSNCRTWIDIKIMVLMQMVIFLPLSLIRDISKLGGTALVADFFILLGLVYIYYYDTRTIVTNHGVSDIKRFNAKDWTLFVGTAIFTFEGIGLVIPIRDSMRKPSKFPPVLAGVMIILTVVYISMGALSYAAYGSATRTVVLLNMPQDDRLVNAVQLLYSLAILLSTPLQLFPAIRIMENGIFSRSGKHNPYIKWKKNIFRFFLVMACALLAWGGADDLDKFVALVGSFACVPLVYIYPVSHSPQRPEPSLNLLSSLYST